MSAAVVTYTTVAEVMRRVTVYSDDVLGSEPTIPTADIEAAIEVASDTVRQLLQPHYSIPAINTLAAAGDLPALDNLCAIIAAREVLKREGQFNTERNSDLIRVWDKEEQFYRSMLASASLIDCDFNRVATAIAVPGLKVSDGADSVWTKLGAEYD